KPELRQLRAGAYARKHHDVRRADGSRREDHLPAATRAALFAILTPTHADRPFAVQLQSLNQTAEFKLQILPVQHRLEKPARCRPSAALLLVDVEITDALIVTSVEILDGRNAVLVCSQPECVENFPGQPRVLDPPLSSNRMVITFEKMIYLPAKIGPHVVPRPPGRADLSPMIIIACLAEHIDHAVDRRGPADHLAARIVQDTPVEPRFCLRLKQPVGTRIADGKKIADRNMKPDPVVFAACL